MFILYVPKAFGGNKACFNLLCGHGFVQVDSKNPVDTILKSTTIYGREQYILELYVFKDKVTGNWWFQVNDIRIGYWINTLVPRLEGGVSRVA
ncbi:hypothetical protein IFM89_039481 [Coptis chinensis]|uniref:Neprosin PEP catalytic domain-containing protein n=1 Tax=Coptis chinensis TaxID=261450 RepID=A0A835IHT0_9MAGN|nr:hypothetical protein IFM89_039481 [Coptis chinensis]